MVEAKPLTVRKPRKPLVDFSAVWKAFQKAGTNALVDLFKAVRDEPFSHRFFVSPAYWLIGVNVAHYFGASDLQSFANSDPVGPTAALACHGLLTYADFFVDR